ncbi:MAG: DUF1925 domain-containing protein [SAR202 cluster bacterium]|nr:DUF1925 domain-containing protein [SAR202 cluster bacterium]MQG79592.1 DUF1925 domain-containing protein [SAR202 cluster bacterium]
MGQVGALFDAPSQGVLASARADDQYFHEWFSGIYMPVERAALINLVSAAEKAIIPIRWCQGVCW